MVIEETSIFTRRVRVLLDDESYRLLQLALVRNPERGVAMHGTGVLRKVRWGVEGGGKRGGIRVVYNWFPKREVILMLMIYAKNERDDLSGEQRRIIRRLIARGPR